DYASVVWSGRERSEQDGTRGPLSGKVRPNVLARVLEALMPEAKKTCAELRSLAAKDQRVLVSPTDYGLKLGENINWPHLFAKGNKALEKRYVRLRDMVNKNGIDILGKEPQITISTMHGAKGKEADAVIIVPDCTDIVRR